MIFYVISAALFLAGVVVFVVFGKDTVEEAQGRLGALASWPGRFVSYRSGHGRHTPRAVAYLTA